jgi:hypothetical protein
METEEIIDVRLDWARIGSIWLKLGPGTLNK